MRGDTRVVLKLVGVVERFQGHQGCRVTGWLKLLLVARKRDGMLGLCRGVLGVISGGRLRLEAGLARKDVRHGVQWDFLNRMDE